MDSFPDIPLTTLTGLGPPAQMAGDPDVPPALPETLRPWALTEEAEDDAHGELTEIHVPLSPVVPAWSRVALGAMALLASGSVGVLLGRGPLSPHVGSVAPNFPSPTAHVVRSSAPVPPPASIPATASASAPTGSSSEAERSVEPSPEATRKKHHRGHVASTSEAASAKPLGPDPARIRAVADEVHLEDEGAD